MSRLRLLTALLAILVALPLAFEAFRQFSADASVPATYTTFAGGDEIFVVKAAESVLNGGYLGMRCRNGHTGSCYGGSQILADGFLLKLVPSGWLKGDTITRPAGLSSWPYLQTYPRMLQFLRWTRVAQAAVLILTLGLITWWSTGDLLATTLFPLALASSPVFASAWQGAKNDFSSATMEVLFVAGIAAAFRARGWRPLLLGLALGTLAVFVRPVYLPMLVLFPFAYCLKEWLRGNPGGLAVLQLCASGAGISFFFVLLHPNIFASSYEANWIIALLSMGSRQASLSDRLSELRIAAGNAWPWLFVFGGWLAARARLRSHWVSGAYFLANGIFLYLINVKTAHFRAQYYLPGFALALPLAAIYWPREARPRALLGTGFALALCLVSGQELRARGWGLRAAAPQFPESALETLVKGISGNWLVDLSLQAPLRAAAGANIRFFDSLAESPAEVAANLGVAEKILVTCWSKKPGGSFDSPAARAWAELTGKCSSRSDLDERIFSPFVTGNVPSSYLVLTAEDLLRSSRTAPQFIGQRISPRIFRGFWLGMDNYGSALLLSEPAKLTASLRLPAQPFSLHLPVASDCKDAESAITLSVTDRAGHSSVVRAPLANPALFCRDYPRLCRFDWFSRWSKRRFPPPGGELKLDWARAFSGPLDIEINTVNKNCTVELQNLQLIQPSHLLPH